MGKTGGGGVTHAESLFWRVGVVPAVTVTFGVATASSSWYSVWTYWPGFMAGLEKSPFVPVPHQYWAVELEKATVAVVPLATPAAAPTTSPRWAVPVAPASPRSYMKLMSGAAGAGVARTLNASGPVQRARPR